MADFVYSRLRSEFTFRIDSTLMSKYGSNALGLSEEERPLLRNWPCMALHFLVLQPVFCFALQVDFFSRYRFNVPPPSSGSHNSSLAVCQQRWRCFCHCRETSDEIHRPRKGDGTLSPLCIPEPRAQEDAGPF
jgi:hypothetical protein